MTPTTPQPYTPSIAKTSYALRQNVTSFVKHHGVERCGFLTLTFAEDITDVREASSRFNSFRTNILSKYTLGYIGVYERTKRGVVHFHFVVAFSYDIRNGKRYDKRLKMDIPTTFDFDAAKKRLFISAPDSLRQIWAMLRHHLPKYGFGIQHRLVPIKDADKVGAYVAKYIAKGLIHRKPQDKGFRFVRSTIGKKAQFWRQVSSNFAWLSDRNKQYRRALAKFLTQDQEHLLDSFYTLKKRLERARSYRPDYAQRLDKLTDPHPTEITHQNYSEIMQFLGGAKWCYRMKHTLNYLIEQENF